MSSSSLDSDVRSVAYLKLAIVVAVAIGLAILVLLHVDGLNGPSYWRWRWREPAIPALRWYAAVFVAAMPALIGAWLATRFTSTRSTIVVIVLLMISSASIRFASAMMVREAFDLSLTAEIVKSPIATSYFGDAGYLSTRPDWLAEYPDVLYFTSLHTQSKPPGPVAYWIGVIRLLGYNDTAALAGAIILGMLGSLAIPATYWTILLLTQHARAAVIAAGWMALAPGCTLFFPMFDPAYVAFACALVSLWYLAILRDDARWGACFGLVLAVAVFFSYVLLALGVFLMLLGLFCTGRTISRAVAVTIRQAAIGLGVCVGLYLLLSFTVHFDPIATFRAAWTNQQLFLKRHESARVYPATILPDVIDFLLGGGWIIALPIAYYLCRRRNWTRLVGLCIAQPLFVATTGLVQSETARVWMFMLPLWLVPASLELARWPRWMPVATLAALGLLSAVIGQNMTLIAP